MKLKPHITEKSYRGITEDTKAASTYTFIVDPSADKAGIKLMVEKEYKVKVTDVRTVNLPGKVRRFKGIKGKTCATTKALVTLKKGDRIAAFDLPEQQATPKEK